MTTASGHETTRRGSQRMWAFVGVGLILCILVAGILSRFASGSPDGLEKVAEDTGFIADAQDSANAGSLLADYGDVAGIPVGVAGVIGVLIMTVVAFALFMWLGRSKRDS